MGLFRQHRRASLEPRIARALPLLTELMMSIAAGSITILLVCAMERGELGGAPEDGRNAPVVSTPIT